jgi:2-phospho-L-lactate transferase/gluconeogenesis factor (CofD/UPF0052 family)
MVHDYLIKIKEIIGFQVFDWVIYNNKKPENAVLKQYEEEGENLVLFDKKKTDELGLKYFSADLLSRKAPKVLAHDKLKRNLIRHNSLKIANLINKIYHGR